jgi:hypothetical protein
MVTFLKNLVPFFFFFLFFSKSSSQVISSPNTIYLIPPTNGCNGSWAILDTIHCGTYAIDPCFQLNHVNGDTIFLDLCSLPCNFISTNPLNGNICLTAYCLYSSTSTFLSQSVSYTSVSYLNNEMIELNFSGEIPDYIYLLTIDGCYIARFDVSSSQQLIKTTGFAAGIYFLHPVKSGQKINPEKIIIR